jgi:uncharacterized protein
MKQGDNTVDPAQKWVLITGGSSGIGFELAKLFAAENYALILVARDKEKLEKAVQELGVEPNRVKIFSKDLSDKNAPAELFAELQRENFFVSVLVNNAGFGRQSFFSKTSLPEQLEMIDVNVGVLVNLTHLFLQPMLARGEGKILNVASTASFQPGPGMSIYYASKAFVLSFSYAIADELETAGITVTALCPGPTQTAFHKRAGRSHSKKVLGLWMMGAREVAQSGFNGLMRGKRIVIPGFLNKLGYFFTKILPVKIPTKVARKVIRAE